MLPFQYNNLPKHKKYQGAYKRFDLYWGIGVEHETYFRTSQTKDIHTFVDAMKPERYSVNYYEAYNQTSLPSILQQILAQSNGPLKVPVLVNSHSFTHCDIYGFHKTTYEKVPKPNNQYAGQTMFEWVSQHNEWFRINYDKCFVWDGDTVEIMTQQFYKATVSSVMDELRSTTKRLESELKKLPRQGILVGYGPLTLAHPRNEPWAVYLTNPKHVAMFNNGTIHINLTLPTRLNWSRTPMFWKSFVNQHQCLARCIQWVEPILIAMYGSGDPLATVSDRFAHGSQRVAVSRYIGLGTFDTETMTPGKLLQIPRVNFPWYDWLRSRTEYAPLKHVGLDINFNKHGAHGLEIRCFDQMPYDQLETLLRYFILSMDTSLHLQTCTNPVKHPVWISAAGTALLEGKGWMLTVEEQDCFCKQFGICDWLAKEPISVIDFVPAFMECLGRYRGICWARMAS